MSIRTKIRKRLHGAYVSREIKNHYLQYLFLEITKRCNLDCLHCGSDCKKEIHSPELTVDSWLKIIEHVKNQFSSSVAFIITGGEPLMHPGIYEIGSFIHQNNMRWGIVTNGMLLNKLNLEKLVKAGISSITISLDGLEDSHNWLRNNKSSFDKTINALKLIANSGIEQKDVVSCVSPKNLGELKATANLLVENGIKDWRLFRIFPSGRANENANLKLSFEQTQQMLSWIENNRLTYKKKGLNINLSCEGWVPFEKDVKIRDFPFFCRSGINIASILSDGTITGCSNNQKGFHVGDILRDNFKTTWENKFNIFREKQWLKNTICGNCKHIKSCRGSSIHLWELGSNKPKFCYAIDMDNS